MKGWKNHSKPGVVQEYRRKLLEERGYVAIEGDRLADTIWLWWNEIGNRGGYGAGTLSSSCQLADFLRQHGLIVEGTVDEETTPTRSSEEPG